MPNLGPPALPRMGGRGWTLLNFDPSRAAPPLKDGGVNRVGEEEEEEEGERKAEECYSVSRSSALLGSRTQSGVQPE